MKNTLYLLCLACMLNASFAQKVNLGTTYFRNDRYLISFDKVLYPGYQLALENFVQREYLMGSKIKERVLYDKKSWLMNKNETSDQIEFAGFNPEMNSSVFSDYCENPCFQVYEEVDPFNSVELSLKITLKNNRIVYESGSLGDKFTMLSDATTTITRVNEGDKNKIDVVEIITTLDTEKNSLNTVETVKQTRALKENEVVDLEGNIYRTTKIGEQVWMAENLRSTKFNNGQEVPMLTEAQWVNSTAPGLISIGNEGNFYNFFTLASENNICPQGFHVPDHKDIAELYNDITPYGEHLRLRGSSVTRKVYPRVLTPLTYPLGVAVHLGWWAVAASVDVGLFITAAALDAISYSTQAITSPFFGWITKTKQYRDNLKNSRKYKFINTYGVPLEQNQAGTFKFTGLNPLNTKDWDDFQVVKYVKESSTANTWEGELISDVMVLDSLKKAHYNYPYKTKYKLFYWGIGSLTSGISEWLYDIDGGFGTFDMRAYRNVSSEGPNVYPNERFILERFDKKFTHQPVITLLLSKELNQFSDQFGFNLNYDNTLLVVENKRRITVNLASTGISYLDQNNFPGYFGIIKNSTKLRFKKKYSAHELNLLDGVEMINPLDLEKTQTRIRCVKD